MKFVLYIALTTLGVLATCAMWVGIFDVGSVLESTGISLKLWLLIGLLWCLTSGVIAGGLSRDISIWSTDTQLLDSAHPFYQRVALLAKQAGLDKVPQIGIYPSRERDLFTAGPLQSLSVIGVSEGFLLLDDDIQEALIYGELMKIKNGDTALLVFCHGIVHGFVLYLARMLAFLLGTSFRQNEGSSSSTYPEIVVSALATVFLTLWGSILVYGLSRNRNRKGERLIAAKFGPERLSRAQKALADTPKDDEHYDLFTKALKASFPKRAFSHGFSV